MEFQDYDPFPPPVPPPPVPRKRPFENPTPNKKDNVKTPQWLWNYLLDEFPSIESDPCPNDPEEDGLEADWEGWSYVNPPQSECQLWVEKASKEAAKGNYSVMLVPATFNSVYWREVVYSNATEIRIFKCPVKLDGQERQTTTQMALVVFSAQHGNAGAPALSLIEPQDWSQSYYKRARNLARFGGTH